MTERLEEIKEAYRWTIDNSLVPRLSDSDTEWLINRVKELEDVINKVDDHLVESGKQIMKLTDEKAELEYQNKRLREAIIEAIADIEEISPHEAKKTLREALALECDDD